VASQAVQAGGPVIWLISDGNPGHFNQSLAIAEALQRAGYGSIEWLEARQRIRGFVRPLVAWLIEHSRSALPPGAERMLYRFPGAWPAKQPGLIVSSGGKTAFLNVLLARHLNCPNVFIGPPPEISTRHFQVVLHAEQEVHGENCIAMDYLPTRLDPDKARLSGQAFTSENGLDGHRLCTMLLGGNSRSHHYTRADWLTLAQGMNNLAKKYAFSWLVTSSRRTGQEAEDILRANLDPDMVADATWWGGHPRAVVIPYLGAAVVVFCTQDSLSMLSEAIASGRPTFALFPETLRHDALESSFNERFLATNVQQNRLAQVSIKTLETSDLTPSGLERRFRPVTNDIMRNTIATLLARLQRIEHATSITRP
jgi:mitochondrial fission protein ELM1